MAIAETCYRMGSRLHDDEIGGNARARRILTSLREAPELTDVARREQRLRVGGMEVASLKMKSSHQLKQCLVYPEAHVPEAGGPCYTRTMLLSHRRHEKASAESKGHEAYLRDTGQWPQH